MLLDSRPMTELEIAQQQLTEVRAAISAALKNQSTSLNGRTFTKANLNDLRDMERELLSRVSRLSSGGARRTQRVYLL
jgi:hypothetical protein